MLHKDKGVVFREVTKLPKQEALYLANTRHVTLPCHRLLGDFVLNLSVQIIELTMVTCNADKYSPPVVQTRGTNCEYSGGSRMRTGGDVSKPPHCLQLRYNHFRNLESDLLTLQHRRVRLDVKKTCRLPQRYHLVTNPSVASNC